MIVIGLISTNSKSEWTASYFEIKNKDGTVILVRDLRHEPFL